MANNRPSGFITIRTAFLVGTLIMIPAAAGVATQTTSASPDSGICVKAQWEGDPSIVSYYGDCPEVIIDDPSPQPSSIPTPTPDPIPAEPEWAPTAPPAPVPVPTPTEEPEIDEPDEIIPPSAPVPTPGPTVKPPPAPVTPAENLDPSTKKFKFCHNGSMHSNSYNGMVNGHTNHSADIMPPIPVKNYPGWNWTSKNAETFYNNCNPV